ncbi:hypothetical protein LV89_04228 [Arcicella aurantiaca]|uniref:Uncharacterized protein n=1 Tax=Arcicella aurantiaca TaxID=591202 RepID=A0A316DII9_9BACT|nr:hypothetical protein [Arcicella aurantiaca]PWK18077.1 hypothetical protein LV89_04228 [Arcicella aurantiaca]
METINTVTWNHLLQVLENIRNTPVKPNEKLFEADSLSSINPLAKQRLGTETYQKLRSIWNDASLALSYAKKNDLEQAGKQFAHAKERHNELEGEARALAEILYYPKVAYYYYKIRDFKAADEAISTTLKMDDIMQEVYFTFHGHKLHVLQNNSRTLAYRKEFDGAAKLVLSVLRYLIAPKSKPLYEGKWGKKYLDNYKTVQRLPITFEFFFFDFSMDSFRFPAFETAVIQNSKLICDSLKKVASTDPIYQMAYDWFDAKRSLYIRENVEEYIQKSTAFLNSYPARYDMFKLLLLWDMLRLTKLMNDPVKQIRLDNFLHEHYKVKLVA